MKLWEKGIKVEKFIEEFTIGKDNELDIQLAEYDVLGTIAHTRMLQSIGILTELELKKLEYELIKIYRKIKQGKFQIEEGVEDIHSQIEIMLTDSLGDIGKKVHTGRSRNDQVLVDIKLFTRDKIREITESVYALSSLLLQQSNKYKDVLLPGYTHSQIAMPSSFGLWFGAYAESLSDDLILLQAAYKIANQNPLGSAAGYGSSFPLDRTLTTNLLGFDTLNYNVVNAQMGRGKVEKIVTFALGSIASTLLKLSMDVCLYSSRNFGFITLPDKYTTGSSIMPHKKNPDVFEIIRAKCNKLQGISNMISHMIVNLPSGYHRDMQITKEIFVPAFSELKSCLQMAELMLTHMEVSKNILQDDKYKYIFSVEDVNKQVLEGIPFRDAYKNTAMEIMQEKYEHEGRDISHTHEGSIGNLCNDEIKKKIKDSMEGFRFDKLDNAYKNLLQDLSLL
ncbi:MAG: argininosuccinate lyase [Bacteroidales bacterium]